MNKQRTSCHEQKLWEEWTEVNVIVMDMAATISVAIQPGGTAYAHQSVHTVENATAQERVLIVTYTHQ